MYQIARANGVSALRYSSLMVRLPSPRSIACSSSPSSGSGVKSAETSPIAVTRRVHPMLASIETTQSR